MAISRLLIANRGEVAVRIIRSAAEMGITTVAVYSEDDAECLHVAFADERHPLVGRGVGPYLDMDQLLAVAKQLKCDAIHPGWGFLSENPEFCDRCGKEGVVFVGPRAETLSALGDKTHARSIAASCGVPTLKGSAGPVSLEEARAFFQSLAPGASMIVKAVAGGGGRGMRVVTELAALDSAYARCSSEAQRAFGNGALYVEQRVERARHVEVQVVGDGTGNVSHLWERDCSIQRRHQKVVEIAPSPVLTQALRDRLTGDAVKIASTLAYTGVGTFEFLLDVDAEGIPVGTYAFIEANPRLQVEHTITEEILGLDLVRAQLLVAGGETLETIGLDQARVPSPRGIAMQLRVNTEQMDASGGIRPSTGTLNLFQPPTGPGIRVDTLGYPGYATSSSFDSLLAKAVVHSPSNDFRENVARAARALGEFRIEGVQTNIPFLRNLLDHPDFQQQRIHTTFIDEHIEELAAPREEAESRLPSAQVSGHTAGAKVDAVDPLAVLTYGKSRTAASPSAVGIGLETEPGAVLAPMQSTVVSFEIAVGDTVRKGQDVAVLNAMKMEHVLKAPVAGIVRRLNAAPGDTVVGDQLLILIEETDAVADEGAIEEEIDLDYIRPDLAEVLERHRRTLDEARPWAVESRRDTGHRTARENIEDLCDPGTFVEYGPIVLAAPRQGDSLEDLIKKTPGDGILVGIGAVNGDQFGEPNKWCMVMSYDYTVWAGTQGGRNHAKTDRGIAVAKQGKMPVILIAEGGGGRASGGAGGGGGAGGPGTTVTFAHFAGLSGLVPMVGITTGLCFAGNASLLGCCDVIIATEGSNIGMGGPAMIEGGSLGVFAPEDIGPMDVQVPNGVVDIAVADEAEAMQVAKQYMSYFQGPISTFESADQRKLRHIIPENRLRVYDVRAVIETLSDTDSVLELRKDFGVGMITSFARIEGRPVGIVANNPMYYGGAITSDGSDKAARFMKLCDAFDIPLVFLVDTPGIMVGPEIEKTALVRHSSRMFVVGADVSVPCMAIILRKAYGLGAIAMTAGSYREPYFTVSWPTGEFGGMGLEGQVKLGFRNQLAAIEDTEERRKTFDQMVARAYERGKALNEAVTFGVDDTIDPAESRRWVASVLKSVRIPPRPHGKKRGAIDTW
jgi:acetyl/propionyl-CoA carboxylase alpha subunit/acetyl-CoA carboxylase carboxyltransferase component